MGVFANELGRTIVYEKLVIGNHVVYDKRYRNLHATRAYPVLIKLVVACVHVTHLHDSFSAWRRLQLPNV